MSSHVEEYTLTGIHLKFPDNKERHALQRKYIGLFTESKKGKGQLLYFNFLAQRAVDSYARSSKTNRLLLLLMYYDCIMNIISPYKMSGKSVPKLKVGGGGDNYYKNVR